MQVFGEWCLNNLSLLLSCLLFVVTLILAFLKKRPILNQVDEIKKVALEVIPQFIKQAEDSGMIGTEKFNYVVLKVTSLISRKFNIGDCDWLTEFITISIENVLKTPQATIYKK